MAHGGPGPHWGNISKINKAVTRWQNKAEHDEGDGFANVATGDHGGFPAIPGGGAPGGGGGGWADLIKAISGGGGSGGSSNNYNAINKQWQQKFAYDKERDTLADKIAADNLAYTRRREVDKANGINQYYESGKYNTSFDKLIEMISTQGGVSKGNIDTAYTNANTNIDAGYKAAQGLGDAGFSDLETYLQQNQNNPYANMRAQTGSSPDAMGALLSAYGVSAKPVEAQIAADQQTAKQGAGSYQNLIDILSGVAQSGASSRNAEGEMAQLMFNTGLGQEQAGYKSQASNAQAQALAQLQQQMFQSNFGVEQNRGALAQQLEQIIAENSGLIIAENSGLITKPDVTDGTVVKDAWGRSPGDPLYGIDPNAKNPGVKPVVAPVHSNPNVTLEVLEELANRGGGAGPSVFSRSKSKPVVKKKPNVNYNPTYR